MEREHGAASKVYRLMPRYKINSNYEGGIIQDFLYSKTFNYCFCHNNIFNWDSIFHVVCLINDW